LQKNELNERTVEMTKAKKKNDPYKVNCPHDAKLLPKVLS
jgi:hypothetical protein